MKKIISVTALSLSLGLFLASCEQEVDKITETAKKSEELVTDEGASLDIETEGPQALEDAQEYVDIMSISEGLLHDYLVSEKSYTEEATHYALDNLEVDYNEEALDEAIAYTADYDLEDDKVFDYLVALNGGKFSPDQAQYAIDNLPGK